MALDGCESCFGLFKVETRKTQVGSEIEGVFFSCLLGSESCADMHITYP